MKNEMKTIFNLFYLIDYVHCVKYLLVLYIACALYFDSIYINGYSNNNQKIYGG